MISYRLVPTSSQKGVLFLRHPVDARREYQISTSQAFYQKVEGVKWGDNFPSGFYYLFYVLELHLLVSKLGGRCLSPNKFQISFEGAVQLHDHTF